MPDHIHVSVAWPYANGDMHLGHVAGAYLPADIFARFQRLRGQHVLMVSGSDSHGTPIMVTAEQEGSTPRDVFEKYHRRFLEVQQRIGISYDLFTHTDTENHHQIAQDVFSKLLSVNALYQDTQRLLFDEQADQFLPDRFVEGTCPICGYDKARGDQCDNCGHLLEAVDLINPRSKLTGATPVIRETEHYFLDLAQFKEQLRAYLTDKDYWRPNVINSAREEVEKLRGRPITRDVDWGIPVPLEGWDNKRLYVWFEAVMGYLTASLEWAKVVNQPDLWKRWWHNPEARIYNFIGKDNIPFHTIIWQAELLGITGLYADDPAQAYTLPYDVPANEYLNLKRDETIEQFSKSRHTAIWLYHMLDRYDPDAIRYYVASIIPERRDSEFSWDDFVARNNNELVAWWGNLANRVLKFAYKHWEGHVPDPGDLRVEDRALLQKIEEGFEVVGEHLESVRLRRALDEAMALVREVNVYLDQMPWFGVIKEDKAAAAATVYTALQAVTNLTVILSPFLPFSSQKLYAMLGFKGELFGTLSITQLNEATRSHDALVYDRAHAIGSWRPVVLPAGQALEEPQALFIKLDEKQIIEEETARLGV